MNVLWVDDLRQPPCEDYTWVRSVQEAKAYLAYHFSSDNYKIDVVDLDHDAGSFGGAAFGGDYINILNWLEWLQHEHGLSSDKIPAFCIHSQNPVGVANMRRIIERNNWVEIFSF